MLLAVAALCHPAARAACADADAAAPSITLQPVAPQLWFVAAARGEPDAANGGVTQQIVIARDGARLWLVGSGPTPAFGAALACAIERTTGQAVTDLVNTRAAPEGAMGNVAFGTARRWALPDVIAAMGARCNECLRRLKARLGTAGDSLQADLIRVPTEPVIDSAALGPFDARAFARGPGERTLVLRHRAAAVVVAHGLLWAGGVPDLRDTDSATLLASLRALRSLAAGALLIGEQGGVVPVQAVDGHIAYLEALREAVGRSIARGEVPGTTSAAAELPGFAAAPGYVAWHQLNVQRVWRELEPMLFR